LEENMSELTGRVALVTGAGSGIGREVARAYARAGAAVVVSDVDETGGDETVRMVREADGDARFIAADVADPAACEALVRQTVKAHGRLDVACNNAGIAGESNPTGEHSIDAWERTIDVNLSGVFYCMRHEIPAMLENDGGSIVNVASILGDVGFANAPAYVASKHGVVGLTKNAAIEYAKRGIRVNAVGPAFIHTPMIAHLEEKPETLDRLVSAHPIGRLGTSEEVAEFVLWLSGDRASFVTGAYMPVDGGYLAR
jgi:NAD(P)-dependent dehydrogenase (short-subunit alcohol dehydrogenase family)